MAYWQVTTNEGIEVLEAADLRAADVAAREAVGEYVSLAIITDADDPRSSGTAKLVALGLTEVEAIALGGVPLP